MFPYQSTAEEVVSQYDLNRAQKARAWAAIEERAGRCPLFSVHIYAAAHVACAAQIGAPS